MLLLYADCVGGVIVAVRMDKDNRTVAIAKISHENGECGEIDVKEE